MVYKTSFMFQTYVYLNTLTQSESEKKGDKVL